MAQHPHASKPLQLHSHHRPKAFTTSRPLSHSHCQTFFMLNSSSAFPPTPITPSTNHILEIKHTETTLKAWLQKQGCEFLPDLLFITVSVLFAWVDALDLIAVLQVSLRVVEMEKLSQEEELTCISFHLQGGRCYMEERMYHAQMEVTLFTKAITNLCEEFNTKCHPSLAPLPKYNYTGCISACQTPGSDAEGYWLPTAAHLKCQKWLSTLSEFLTDFPQIQDVPRLYENLLRLSAIHITRDSVF
ncbi:hypothetical protein BDR07DRAFT_1379755 [Suillus spraguei]|nr:hypothetical protein BDR07DRAFT_1379755 [Suillus spraguei]